MTTDPTQAPLVPAYARDAAGNYYRIGGGGGQGVTDHGDLTGRGDDDHPQYIKRVGDTMDAPLVLPPTPAAGTDGGAGADDAATVNYVESAITVSTSEPPGPPARDGLLWFVVVPV